MIFQAERSRLPGRRPPAASVVCPVCCSDVSAARSAGHRIDRLASAISHARVVRQVHITRTAAGSARQNAFTAPPAATEREHLDYRKCSQCGAVCDADLRALTATDMLAKIDTLRRLLAREISRVPRARHI